MMLLSEKDKTRYTPQPRVNAQIGKQNAESSRAKQTRGRPLACVAFLQIA